MTFLAYFGKNDNIYHSTKSYMSQSPDVFFHQTQVGVFRCSLVCLAVQLDGFQNGRLWAIIDFNNYARYNYARLI